MSKHKIANMEPVIKRLGPDETGIHLAENFYKPAEVERITDQAKVNHWLELAQEMFDTDDKDEQAA